MIIHYSGANNQKVKRKFIFINYGSNIQIRTRNNR